MKNKIMQYIKEKNGGVSFAQLENHIEGFGGEYAFGMDNLKTYFWFTLSEDAAKAMNELLYGRQLKIQPCSRLVYIVDGAIPANSKGFIPIAKQPGRKYKQDRWYPVALNLPHQKGIFIDGSE